MIGGKSVSGFVITYNEQEGLRDCLDSMKWVDELVVVDSYSQDATCEIAGEYTDRIIRREFAGYVAQTRFAFEQTTCEWVMWLDADEALTQQAAGEIHSWLAQPRQVEYDGFAFPRKTYFLDRWIKHGGWYPQHKVRFVRREAARLMGREPHPEFVVEGRVKKLKGDILHFSFPGGIVEYAQRSATFAEAAARARRARGKRASLLRLVLNPPFAFFRSYLLRLGILDGVPGLAVGVGTAYHRFIRELRLWELQHAEDPPAFEPADPGRRRSAS